LADVPVVIPKLRQPNVAGTNFARTTVNVETAGTLSLQLNTIDGLQMYADEEPVSLSGNLKIAVKPEPLRLTFTVDTTIRKQPLLLEVDEAEITAVVTLANE
jgi:hypothetical protein